MRNFPYDDDDFKDEVDNFFDDMDDDEYDDDMDDYEMMQMDIAEAKIRQNILKMAVKMAQNSWFWRFKSRKEQIKSIKEIFKELDELMKSNEEEEEK